ncbi:MAG: DUF2062 domain-containing protein [Nitrospirae bacterium]|nr:DUF2062 domain-containing protein [Nitrospirota bacterium]
MALRDKLREVISTHDSPKKIAFSFAVGVFIGMSPVLGLHTVIGIGAAWLFRLNKFVTIIGVYITNPWTIVPIYTFATWVGAKLLGVDKIIPPINWNNISFTYLLREMGFLLWPFVLGSTLLGLLSAIAGYIIIYQAVMRSRQE